MRLLRATLVLAAVAVGQWSDPVVLGSGLQPYGAGPALVPHVGDSMWVFWMGQAPHGRCYEADTWCAAETLLQAEGGSYWPAGVVDDSGRILVACYNGDYPTAPLAEQDSWGIYTVTRTDTGWSPPQLAIRTLMRGFPTNVGLGKARDGSVGLLWDESAGGIPARESVMVSRRTQSGWTPRCCLAPGETDVYCHSGSLVPGDSTDLLVAFSRRTSGTSEVEVWDLNDSLIGMPATFAGGLPRLARGEVTRFLVLTRGDTLLGAENSGAGWSEPTVIAAGTGFGGASLCADPFGWGWACWPNSTQQSVLASYNRGQGWSQPETVVSSGALGSPRIASDGLGNLHCVWFDHTGGGSGELRHARRLYRPGVEESSKPQATGYKLGPTILSGASGIEHLRSCIIFDEMGRRVFNPTSGVYFVIAPSLLSSPPEGERDGVRGSPASGVERGASSVTKVVIQR
ncbi:hypothetical protein JXD38_00285 [candidate division WOR-3 bacterium]|nr:hypothetical protein [candidate division WOR-3 bacterium]